MHRPSPLILGLQILVTALVSVFLIVPAVLSMMAGVTVNYFQGIWRSGVTLLWIGEVWRLYDDTIFLSLQIALATLGVTLLVGVPAAYVLQPQPGPADAAPWRRSSRCRWRSRDSPSRWR